jgi:putative ABC transport system ATP-binding protein
MDGTTGVHSLLTTGEHMLSTTAERRVVLSAANAAPEKDWIIVTRGIKREYDMGGEIVRALRGVDLAVRRNEYVAIMGPSGSGKSTLMNLIGCLDTPTQGTYLLRDKEVAGLDKNELARIRNERVGFVFQNFNLLPQITAFENVEMPLMFGGISRKECKERVHALLDKVGLADRMEHRPTELSGGQMQRVALARALAMNPDIVLADEPTGNLDTKTGEGVLDLLLGATSERRTVILVTHDARIAARADRILSIRDGLVESDGPPAKE